VPAAAPSPVERMLTLYDEVCLKAFPDDKAIDALMAAEGAVPLTPEQVRVTFNDDPGRGWLLDDGDRKIQIMLELPPYHACSVRGTTPNGFGDLTAYRDLTAAFKQTRPGFEPAGPYDMDRPELQIHIHAIGEARKLQDGMSETLLLFDQRVTDPQRRANGETGVDIRFVHQIIDKGAR
jgi:hypothetical protein